MVKRIFNLSNLTLLTALALSAIAAWYSILGLTAIFAAAVLPIIIMGGSLEVAKVVTTVWLHKYWDRISWQLKIYLVPAVIALAFLTSMGIFGFLSKAHMDQGVPTGDIAAKVALIDEKIKTQRENVEVSRKALAQMDAQVDQRLARGDTEAGAERAVAIRKQQAKERAVLQNDIAVAQKEIAKLNEERAPIASELRKVEAEVGPIKYIAALIYGDNPDSNLLERAVRWVIILIVFVFDPLALTLVIASNTSRRWEVYEEPKEEEKVEKQVEPETVTYTIKETPEEIVEPEPIPEPIEKTLAEQHPYLFNPPGSPHPPGVEPCPPMVALSNEPEKSEELNEQPVDQSFELTKQDPEETTQTIDATAESESTPAAESQKETNVSEEQIDPDVTADTIEPAIKTEGVTTEHPIKEIDHDYVSYEGKIIRKEALKEIKPEYFVLTSDNADHPNANFGNTFPKVAKKGETFIRIDATPNKVFKFDGTKWIEVVKSLSDSYLDNEEYIKFLISKVETGEYDVDTLSDVERDRIAEFLTKQPKTS